MTRTTKIEKNMNTERQMTIELKIMQNEDKKEDHPTTAQIFFFP